MEGDKNNFSTFSVPGTMSDVTIASTPLPQAASTATKRRSMLESDDLSPRDSTHLRGNGQEILLSSNQKSRLCQKNNEKEMKRLSLLENSRKSMSDLQKEVSEVLESKKQSNLKRYGNFAEFGHQEQIKMLINLQNLRSYANEDLKYNSDFLIPEENTKEFKRDTHDFEFRVPPVPGGSSAPKKFNMGLVKDKSPRKSKCDTEVKMSLSSKACHNLSSRDNLGNAPKELYPSANCSTFGYADGPMQHRDDRISIASSANSSLGIISSEILDEAHRQPLVDANHDLSLRLAQQLNLDSSLIKDGQDISTLAAERYKERVAAKCEENKENERTSGYSSSGYSDHWTFHGYSSDNSDTRNNTAKRLSALSTGSGGEGELSNKVVSSPRNTPRPMSEINFSSCRRTSSSRSGRSSVNSNPFGGYSNVSVSSTDFQIGEDAMQRLARDESQFSLASARSLSGIYGDADVSFSVNGEKLSMSSFLRSGSGPLGTLGHSGSEAQRPQFGMPTSSPEKKGTPRAIFPPPQEKSTFLVEELPVRDTPWAPHSLMEQFNNIHTTDMTDSDTSVPSLSYISQILEHMNEGANPRDMLAQLMEHKKTKNKPDESMKPNRISSIVESEKSFCQGIGADRSLGARNRSKVQNPSFGAPMNESSSSSICNVTDFEGDEEVCVCVMTPESMDFDVFNELSQPMEYSFSKACYVDGQRKDQAAYVNLPFPKLVLYPGQKRTLTITIAALVGGVIKIKIEVVRKNPITQARECTNVYGKIVAELPKVSLVTHHGEMTPNPDCEFDGRYQHTIVMRNNGRSLVPLKLTLTKVTHENVRFHFGDGQKKTATVMVEPGQTVAQLVQCETPPIFAEQTQETIIPVEARVDFLLATTDLYDLTVVNPVTLSAPLKPYFFGAQSRLLVPSSLNLYNSCDHPVSFKAVVDLGYIVQPSTFTVPPGQTFPLSVNTADIKNPLRRGELTLHSLNPRGMYTVKLREARRSSVSSNSSLATPHGSRATSPTSSSTSYVAPVEELKVACSHKQLVWGGCPLHQTVMKVFYLKNMGRQREKLRLTISDQTRCFKVVSEKETLETEVKLSLQPMENREIKVVMLATVTGPQWGHLTISRICSPADKNVLPLNAFGGRSKVNVSEGVFEFAEHTYLPLDEKTLRSSFVLYNSGDYSAFFRITADSRSSSGLSISPQESVVPAGRTATIHIGLSVTANQLEYLLQQSTQSVCVAKLTICYGDESTRQRLVRLLKLRSLGKPVAHTVAELSEIHALPIASLDKLDDSSNDAEKLWQEDTAESTVEVFIKRSALEARRLDTSVDYIDLSKTIIKDH